MSENTLKQIIDTFDRYDDYLTPKLNRDIEEYRKGQFVLRFVQSDGTPAENMLVSVRQLDHEFKFGCSLFHLDQFPDEERRRLYRDKFRQVFNYAVVPLYWDTLEPEEGKPRFEKDSVHIDRRPPLDLIAEYCTEHRIRMKGHCFVYNSFQPRWISQNNRELKIQIDRRLKAIADRYGDAFEDADVINEMLTIYKNCYPGNGARNLQLTDERDHERWCFDLCRRHFPHTRLFWNEGIHETFGSAYKGHRSFYYMTIEKMLREGVPVEGIGMQYHAYTTKEKAARELAQCCHPLRLLDVFDCYGEFGLPIHISETSIPSFTNEPDDEALQAELTRRLMKLWFGRKHCESIVWWNLADNTAFYTENQFHAGLLREDCSEKPVYRVMDDLINREWHTEFARTCGDELRFSGFYGNYEITVTANDRTSTHTVRLCRDTTGYDNRRCDFRAVQLIV